MPNPQSAAGRAFLSATGSKTETRGAVAQRLKWSQAFRSIRGAVSHCVSEQDDRLLRVAQTSAEGHGEPSLLPKFRFADFEAHAKPFIAEHVQQYGHTSKRLTVAVIKEHLKAKNPAGTCSASTVKNLPSWIDYQQQLKQVGNSYGRKPKMVPLTTLVLDNVGKRDEALARLMGEQERDFEPSPLDECKHSVYAPKDF